MHSNPVCRLLLLVVLFCVGMANGSAQEIRLVEVTMAAPDIVHVVLRDPPFVRGRILELAGPRPEPIGTWVRHEGEWGLVIGPARDHLRLADTPPSLFLDRDRIDDASAYGPIGTRNVVAVYRKSMPYDSGIYPADNGDSRAGASFEHDIYLQLDAPLAAGSQTINWPYAMLADTSFAFDENSMRASALHVTQNGHRRGDLGKSGYLSLWLPGAENGGAVDFRRYGMERFDIIDGDDDIVFTGAVALRTAPDDPEPGNGMPAPLVEYTDGASVPVSLTGRAGETFFTDRPHGFAVGQRIALERLGGEMDASAVFATVASAGVASFTLTTTDSALPHGLSPYARATPALSANRAGTFVFELDYSAWLPATNGTYRLRIPGLGVSDPLVIDDDVWRSAALNGLTGLYHHRSGMALDGRFGYTRPASFRPGPALTVLYSRLPLAWSSEYDGFVPFADAAGQDWITTEAAPDTFWGGYMDAGDWDRRIQHLDVANLLMQVHDVTAPDRWLRDTGLPKAAEVLDPALYAGSQNLPGLVQEAIWVVDFFRRLQAPDGSIHGGIESAEHPLRGEPSYLEHQTVFAYAPDHISSFRYAATAANLSRLLRNLDAGALAEVYMQSAIAAWQAGERGFTDPDTFYADAIAAAAQAGTFADTLWEERREAMQLRASDYRAAAAAALFRLTGRVEYGHIFEERWQAGLSLFAPTGDAAWDYLQASNGQPDIAEAIRDSFEHEAMVVVDAQSGFAYPGLKHPAAPSGWGQGGPPAYPELQVLMRAHQLSGNPAILRAMEQAHHVMLGANQLGLSLVTGAGLRTINNPLHEDRLAMAVASPSGITIYGWASQAQTAHGWIYGPPWSPLPEVGEAENAASRRIEPPRFSVPYVEYLVQHPALVMQQEYTVQQTIGTMTALALYIDAQQD